jgi:transglutaminase-like putative cysteine protease
MREFVVDVELVVEMAVHNPFDFFLDEGASTVPFQYEAALRKELAPFLESSETGPLFGAYVAEVRRELDGPRASGNTLRTIDFMVALNQRIQKDVKYVIRLEPGVQSPEVTLGKGSGSCRDSAWLMCQTLRHLGFAARFASGYLIQLAPDVKALDGPSGTEVDFTDLHAWCEVYLPAAGWIGFDPTNNTLADERYVKVAVGRDYDDVAPVVGSYHGHGHCRMEVHVEVEKI